MNIGTQNISFSLYDQATKLGAKGLVVPSHSIQTYTWQAGGKMSVEAEALVRGSDRSSQEEKEEKKEAKEEEDWKPPKGKAGVVHPPEHGRADSAASPWSGVLGGKATLHMSDLASAADAGLIAERAEEAEAALAADVAAAQRMQAQPAAAPRAPSSNAGGRPVLAVAAVIVVATAAALLASANRRRHWRVVGAGEDVMVGEQTQGADYAPFISAQARNAPRRGARALA
jgi:hypothetical protein